MKIKIFYRMTSYANQMPLVLEVIEYEFNKWAKTVNVVQISTGLGASRSSTEYSLTVLYTEKEDDNV